MPSGVPSANHATFQAPLQAPNRQRRNKLSATRTPRDPPLQTRSEHQSAGSAGSLPSPRRRSDCGSCIPAEAAAQKAGGRRHGAFRHARSVPGRRGRILKECPGEARGTLPPDLDGQPPARPVGAALAIAVPRAALGLHRPEARIVDLRMEPWPVDRLQRWEDHRSSAHGPTTHMRSGRIGRWSPVASCSAGYGTGGREIAASLLGCAFVSNSRTHRVPGGHLLPLALAAGAWLKCETSPGRQAPANDFKECRQHESSVDNLDDRVDPCDGRVPPGRGFGPDDRRDRGDGRGTHRLLSNDLVRRRQAHRVRARRRGREAAPEHRARRGRDERVPPPDPEPLRPVLGAAEHRP